MNRFAAALTAAQGPDQFTLAELAKHFLLAVEGSVADDQDPAADPAVLVLGSFIGFHAHVDVNTASGYHTLLSMCEQRFNESPELQ